MASNGECQVFRLVSREGPSYTVKKAAAMQLQIVQNLIEDLDPIQNEVIVPTPNVDSKTLEKIVRWCNEHVRVEEIDPEVIKRWEDKFIGELTLDELYDLLEASNYLAANALLHRLCGRVVDIIRGKTPDEIRTVFGIKNDFSEEQQVEINHKNSWAWTTHDVEPVSEPKGYYQEMLWFGQPRPLPSPQEQPPQIPLDLLILTNRLELAEYIVFVRTKITTRLEKARLLWPELDWMGVSLAGTLSGLRVLQVRESGKVPCVVKYVESGSPNSHTIGGSH